MAIINKEVQELVDEKLKEAVDSKLNDWVETKVKKLIGERLSALEAKVKERETRQKRVAIVASKGSMDMAYPPLILASSAVPWIWKSPSFLPSTASTLLTKKNSSI